MFRPIASPAHLLSDLLPSRLKVFVTILPTGAPSPRRCLRTFTSGKICTLTTSLTLLPVEKSAKWSGNLHFLRLASHLLVSRCVATRARFIAFASASITLKTSPDRNTVSRNETVEILFHAVLAQVSLVLHSPRHATPDFIQRCAATRVHSIKFVFSHYQRSLSDLLSHRKTILASNNARLATIRPHPALHIAANFVFEKSSLRLSSTTLHRGLQLKMSEVMGLRTQIMENILGLQPQLLEPRWLLYCEMKANDEFNEGDSGEIINPDDQLYTKSHASENGNSGHELYTVVLALNEYFGQNTTIRIRKASGATPEKAYRELLKQTALALTEHGHVAM
ncbi:hypothetical protein KCU93_g9061, partial [Aureobasidium melanogenum]